MGINQSVLEAFLPKFGGDNQTPGLYLSALFRLLDLLDIEESDARY